MPPHHPARLVIFDLDGTLLDSLPDTFRCFQEAVAPHLGRTPTEREILDRFGPADQEIISSWVGPEHAASAVARLYACYRESLSRTQPFPGIVEMLDDLRAAGSELALFTGRGRPSTDVLLEASGLASRFPTTVTGEEAPAPKPAPDGIRMILDRLGVDAVDAVYVGDTEKDVEAAMAAGVHPVAVLWASHDTATLKARWDLTCVQTVGELAEVLGA